VGDRITALTPIRSLIPGQVILTITLSQRSLKPGCEDGRIAVIIRSHGLRLEKEPIPLTDIVRLLAS
jgi:hypothetical protein